MIALFLVYPIGIFLTVMFILTVVIVGRSRQRRAAREFSTVSSYAIPPTLREFYEEPPPPAPKPRPDPAEPAFYMRRWGFLRQKWEAAEKDQWDKDFGLLDHQAAVKARWEEARREEARREEARKEDPLEQAARKEAERAQRDKELFAKLRHDLQNLG